MVIACVSFLCFLKSTVVILKLLYRSKTCFICMVVPVFTHIVAGLVILYLGFL